MKIALIGPGSTGKTTLAELFSKKHNYPLVPEFAREVAKDLRINDIGKMTPAERDLFQSEVTIRKVSEEAKHTHFIADRSILDGYVYYILHGIKTNSLPEDDKGYYANCVNYARSHYDLLLFMPPAFEYQNDGFRLSRTTEFAAELLLLGILAKERIPFNVFHCAGSPEQRLELLTKIVFLRERQEPHE